MKKKVFESTAGQIKCKISGLKLNQADKDRDNSRAFYKLKKKMGITFRKKPTITIKIFRSLIEPILLYASDFWGILKMPANNPIETFFMSFCKQLLGVQKQSTNNGVLLELGQFPLLVMAKKRATKNWVRMATYNNCSKILYESYQYSCEKSLSWTENMKAMLSENGLMESFDTRDPETHLNIFRRLTDIFHQTTLENIKKEDCKLRTYALFKTYPGFEKYLDEILCIKERTALTKFRISNSTLMIEKGRHMNIDKDSRFCPFCLDKVEDEKHFLIECPTYRHLRSDLYREVKTKIPSICNQPYSYRFLTLMQDLNAPPTSRFICKAMEVREFLKAQPRRND